MTTWSWTRTLPVRSSTFCESSTAGAIPSDLPVFHTCSQADKENAEETEQAKPAQTHPFGLPLALVKRIMCMDNEVRSVSADGLKAAAKSAELIIQLLTEKAYKVSSK